MTRPTSGQSGAKRGLALTDMSDLQQKIAERVKARGRCVVKDLVEDLDETPLRVRNSLRTLVREGHVARIGRGAYGDPGVVEDSEVRHSADEVQGHKGIAKGSGGGATTSSPSPRVRKPAAPVSFDAGSLTGREGLEEAVKALKASSVVETRVIAAWMGGGKPIPVFRLAKCATSVAAKLVQKLDVDYSAPLTREWLDEALKQVQE